MALCSSDGLRAKRELKLSDLNGRPWALLERNVNHSVYDRLQKAMSEDGAHPSEVQHILQAAEAAAFILQNDSVALLVNSPLGGFPTASSPCDHYETNG